MPAKLFITAPHYLAERELRTYLAQVRLVSITYAPSVSGALWSVELSTAEDVDRATVILNTLTRQNNHTLSVVSADSPAGKTLEQLFTTLTFNRA